MLWLLSSIADNILRQIDHSGFVVLGDANGIFLAEAGSMTSFHNHGVNRVINHTTLS